MLCRSRSWSRCRSRCRCRETRLLSRSVACAPSPSPAPALTPATLWVSLRLPPHSQSHSRVSSSLQSTRHFRVAWFGSYFGSHVSVCVGMPTVRPPRRRLLSPSVFRWTTPAPGAGRWCAVGARWDSPFALLLLRIVCRAVQIELRRSQKCDGLEHCPAFDCLAYARWRQRSGERLRDFMI